MTEENANKDKPAAVTWEKATSVITGRILVLRAKQEAEKAKQADVAGC